MQGGIDVHAKRHVHDVVNMAISVNNVASIPHENERRLAETFREKLALERRDRGCVCLKAKLYQ